MENLLPSKYQVKDVVDIEFFKSGRIRNARITKVHFSEEKVMYDVEIMTGQNTTRIHNIDSVFVTDPQPAPRKIRAKFNVAEITSYNNGGGSKVVLLPVMGDSPENKEFWKYTPGGKIEISLSAEDAPFEKAEYYVDFTKTE